MVVVVLGVGAGAELVVPVGFEGIGDQPVGGIDEQVPLARQLGLVLGALDLEAAQPIRLVEARLDLLPNGEGPLASARWSQGLGGRR